MRTALVRARRTALVLYNDPEGMREWRLHAEKLEANHRARVTPFLCHAIINGLEEGAELIARRILEPALGELSQAHIRRLAPSYTFIRDFLYREYDADRVLACSMALMRVASRNRRWDRRFESNSRAEEGWL